MNFKYCVCILGLSAILIGCGNNASLPEASTVNCQGRGLEIALQAFVERGTEDQRQAFIDECNAREEL